MQYRECECGGESGLFLGIRNEFSQFPSLRRFRSSVARPRGLAYYTVVAPLQGKPLRLQRAVSQAMDVGVRALPILSLITFFIGLILALQAAYELRRFGAMNYVATAVGCQEGFSTGAGAEQVGRSTTRAVVMSIY